MGRTTIMAKKQKTPGVKALRKLVDDTRAAREKLTQRAERAQTRIAALGDKLAAHERLLADALEARAGRATGGAQGGGSTPSPPAGDSAATPARRRTTTAGRGSAAAGAKKTTTRRAKPATKPATTPRSRTTAKRATTPRKTTTRAARKPRTTPPPTT
jgi:hypothetical protein